MKMKRKSWRATLESKSKTSQVDVQERSSRSRRDLHTLPQQSIHSHMHAKRVIGVLTKENLLYNHYLTKKFT